MGPRGETVVLRTIPHGPMPSKPQKVTRLPQHVLGILIASTMVEVNFMAKDSMKSLQAALDLVRQDRRGFLKTMLVGSAVAALPLMTSQTMAAEGEGGDEGKKKKKKEGE